jgi:cellulose synthase/poly-beta-1,6-N-acetylglucosamine synthase-like glycosyltransferase
MKEVSIIIPAIRWEPFTEQCVRGCADLFPDAAIILVLDDTRPIESSFKNLTVLYGQTGMISSKRNIGVKTASTEFIAFIDSDAYPHRDWLSCALQTLLIDHSAGMVGGPNISPLDQEPERNLVGMATKSWLVAGKWNFYKSEKSTARYCDNLPSCNLILRKSLYDRLNGMNEDLEVGEDTDFCSRMIAGGDKVYFNQRAIVYHYDRKIPAYIRQRMVRGAGVYLHLFGHSAQRRNLYTYLLLQPALTLLFLLSFPLGFLWFPWFIIVTAVAGVGISLILIEAYKYAARLSYLPIIFLLIAAGNLLPGLGFWFKAFHLLPSLQSFYRNDES